uniref:Uncharacterized protein n=1 Tax=Rhizophora mucronata TaxID=61149 RepID=A0A2P2QTV2_RHIMU
MFSLQVLTSSYTRSQSSRSSC